MTDIHPIYEFPVWVAGAAFLGGTFLIILFILISRVVKSSKENKSEYFKDLFSKGLNNLIIHEVYSEDGNPPSALAFQLGELKKEMNKSALAKQVMIDQMMVQRENLSGGTSEVIERAYTQLSLHQFSLKKLKSLRWKIRDEGIRELTKMNCHEGIGEIKAITRIRNKAMKDKALVALVRLDEQKDLSFLSDYEGELTQWMLLNIHHHLRNLSPAALPDFRRWFNSPNRSVLVFSINMAGEFRQSSAIPGLTAFLFHPDTQIVDAAIDALEAIEAHSSFKDLLGVADRHWTSEKTMTKLANCLGKLALPSNGIPVLQRFLDHPSYEVRFQAIKGICQLGPEQKAEINRLDLASGLKNSKILLHLSEPLLT